MIETGVTEKRKCLEYEGSGIVRMKEVEWICLTEEGEDELLLNGYIPCNFSYSMAREAGREGQHLAVYECVNPARNPFIHFQYVVKTGDLYGNIPILIKDLLALLQFFNEQEKVVELVK
jgi:hypothetical protein